MTTTYETIEAFEKDFLEQLEAIGAAVVYCKTRPGKKLFAYLPANRGYLNAAYTHEGTEYTVNVEITHEGYAKTTGSSRPCNG